MQKKQLYHIAEEIAKQEIILRKKDSLQEEKNKAMDEINRWVDRIAAMKDGFIVMMELDEIIQKKIIQAEKNI